MEKINPAMEKPEMEEVKDASNVSPDLQERQGLQERAKKLYNVNDFDSQIEKNKLDVKSIKNISGTILIISDLRSEVDQEGLSLNPNEEIDVTLHYEPKEINRSRRLYEAIKDGYVGVTEFCSKPGEKVEYPDVNEKRLTIEGNEFIAPYNEYDAKYEKVLEDEEKRNQNQNQEARRTRK